MWIEVYCGLIMYRSTSKEVYAMVFIFYRLCPASMTLGSQLHFNRDKIQNQAWM